MKKIYCTLLARSTQFSEKLTKHHKDHHNPLDSSTDTAKSSVRVKQSKISIISNSETSQKSSTRIKNPDKTIIFQKNFRNVCSNNANMLLLEDVHKRRSAGAFKPFHIVAKMPYVQVDV